MTASPDFLLYGAYGYTGRLIAEAAAARGLRPLLAGRDAGRLAAVGEATGLPWRAVDLGERAALEATVDEVPVVLHCAGPFAHTWRAMADACLAVGSHYLDVTGEAEVFTALQGRDEEARARRVMLLPGVGFDVVPSDGLAAHLARRLPSATRLRLVLRALGGLSQGTALTMVENIGRGGLVRQDGELRRVPAAWKTRTVEIDGRHHVAVTIPWGDVATAWVSTGIPDIEVYAVSGRAQRLAMRASRHLGGLLGGSPVQGWLRRRIRAGGPGPSVEARQRGKSVVWGEVMDDAGERRSALLSGPEGYAFTVETALLVVRRVLAGTAPVGYQTPSTAYGPDLALEVPGVERRDDVGRWIDAED